MNVRFINRVQVFGTYEQHVHIKPGMDVKLTAEGVEVIATRGGQQQKLFVPMANVQCITYPTEAVVVVPEKAAKATKAAKA